MTVDRVVLVPVKSFADAKARLAGVLSATQREQLARFTAERVLRAAEDLTAYVVCDDHDVADWARTLGAEVLWRPGVGLDAAVNGGIDELRALGVELVIVAHGDLACARSLGGVARHGTITLVPDVVGDGTNVAAVPTDSAFRFTYGPGSFQRHLRHALALGTPVSVCHDPLLAIDIDTPSDLAHPLVQEVLPSWLRMNPDNPTQPAH